MLTHLVLYAVSPLSRLFSTAYVEKSTTSLGSIGEGRRHREQHSSGMRSGQEERASRPGQTYPWPGGPTWLPYTFLVAGV